MNSGQPVGVPPSPQAHGWPQAWRRLMGQTITAAYSHPIEAFAGGGTLHWYDCQTGDSVCLFSANDEDKP